MATLKNVGWKKNAVYRLFSGYMKIENVIGLEIEGKIIVSYDIQPNLAKKC